MTYRTPPVIETERLELRAHTRADFEAYRDAFASDHTRFMGGPIDARQAWASFCKDVAQWSLLGHGAWAVTRKADGEFVGQVGLNAHPYFPETELGWLVLPHATRQGIASEAAQAARGWAFETLGLETLVSYIHAENAASRGLAEALGAQEDPQAAPCPFDNHVVYRHPMPEAA